MKDTEPKLVYVEFLDHAQHFSLSESGTFPEDLKDLPVPLATISLCGWCLKESEEAIWLFAMKTNYPKELSSVFDLRSEGYHAYWCILKKNILRLEEIKLKEEGEA